MKTEINLKEIHAYSIEKPQNIKEEVYEKEGFLINSYVKVPEEIFENFTKEEIKEIENKLTKLNEEGYLKIYKKREKEWECIYCKEKHNRDYNAALNIKELYNAALNIKELGNFQFRKLNQNLSNNY